MIYAYINGIAYEAVRNFSVTQQTGNKTASQISVLVDNQPIPQAGDIIELRDGETTLFWGTCGIPRSPKYSTGREWRVYDITCGDANSILSYRLANEAYQGYTITQIVADLYARYIAEEGVALGTISAIDITLDKYVLPDYNLQDALNELANQAGAIWMIDNNRVFSFVVFDDFPACPLVFSDRRTDTLSGVTPTWSDALDGFAASAVVYGSSSQATTEQSANEFDSLTWYNTIELLGGLSKSIAAGVITLAGIGTSYWRGGYHMPVKAGVTYTLAMDCKRSNAHPGFAPITLGSTYGQDNDNYGDIYPSDTRSMQIKTITPAADGYLYVQGYASSDGAINNTVTIYGLWVAAGTYTSATFPYSTYSPGSPSASNPSPVVSLGDDGGIDVTVTGVGAQTATVNGDVVLSALPDGTRDSWDAVSGAITRRVGVSVIGAGSSWTISDAKSGSMVLCTRCPQTALSGNVLAISGGIANDATIYYTLENPYTEQTAPLAIPTYAGLTSFSSDGPYMDATVYLIGGLLGTDYQHTTKDYKVRTVQYISGATDTTTTQDEDFTYAGQNSFTVTFGINQKPAILINSVAVDPSHVGVVGLDNDNADKWFLFAFNSAEVSYKSESGALDTGDTLTISYIGIFPIRISVANNSRVKELAALTGTSGKRELSAVASNIRTRADAMAYAASLLERFAVATGEISLWLLSPELYAMGLTLGDVALLTKISFDIPAYGMTGDYVIVERSITPFCADLSDYERKIKVSLRLVNRDYLKSYGEILADLRRDVKSLAIRDSDIIIKDYGIEETLFCAEALTWQYSNIYYATGTSVSYGSMFAPLDLGAPIYPI